MPVETDYAWAAGFLDGEGSFLAVQRKSVNTFSYNPEICASQTSRDPLIRLQLLFGGSICEVTSKRQNPEHCRVWKWCLMTAQGCRDVIPKILPYLTLKAEEARVLLSLCMLIGDKKRVRRINPWNRRLRSQYAARLVEIRTNRRMENMFNAG